MIRIIAEKEKERFNKLRRDSHVELIIYSIVRKESCFHDLESFESQLNEINKKTSLGFCKKIQLNRDEHFTDHYGIYFDVYIKNSLFFDRDTNKILLIDSFIVSLMIMCRNYFNSLVTIAGVLDGLNMDFLGDIFLKSSYGAIAQNDLVPTINRYGDKINYTKVHLKKVKETFFQEASYWTDL